MPASACISLLERMRDDAVLLSLCRNTTCRHPGPSLASNQSSGPIAEKLLYRPHQRQRMSVMYHITADTQRARRYQSGHHAKLSPREFHIRQPLSHQAFAVHSPQHSSLQPACQHAVTMLMLFLRPPSPPSAKSCDSVPDRPRYS
jgi:hypothetical protein